MKRILIFSIVCLTSIIVSLGQSVESTILPPTGYTREVCDEHSFAAYLRQLPLLPKGSKVLLYNGQEKRNQAAAFAVVDMEIGNRDLQQCADAARSSAQVAVGMARWCCNVRMQSCACGQNTYGHRKDTEKSNLTLPMAFRQNIKNGRKETVSK